MLARLPNYLDLHAARLGVDLLTINGGKACTAPSKVALCTSRRTVGLRPLIDGGGQERGPAQWHGECRRSNRAGNSARHAPSVTTR